MSKEREFARELFALSKRYLESGDLDKQAVADIMRGAVDALDQAAEAEAAADRMTAAHLKAAGRLT